jgi:CheY-like chemotaxis protein
MNGSWSDPHPYCWWIDSSCVACSDQSPHEIKRAPEAEQGKRVTAEILIVDDDASVRMGLSKLLSCRGYRLTTVENGATALRCAGRLCPTVILMDVHMPKMGGIATARALKADPALAHVPIIGMSAEPLPAACASLFASFLLKPVSSMELLEAIDHAMRR